MTLYAKVDTGKEAPSWDSYTPSLRESVQASWEAALASNPTTSLLRLHEVMLAERGLNKDAVLDLIDEAENGGLASFADLNALPEPRKLSLEEQTRRIREAGLNGVLEAREGYTSEVLDILIPQKQAELSHRFVASRAPASHMPFSLVAGFGASALDPINLASAFVPAVGEARALSLLRQSAGSAGRAATRAKIGLAGGVAGAVLTEPFVYAGQKAIQADYGMADSLLNIGFGAVMGAGMQPLAGGVGDFFRTRRGIRQPWEIAEKTDVSEALRLDLAGRMEKAFLAANPEADAEQVQRNALASAALFDARARAREYDTGLKVEDFYRKYGPQFRSWREDVASSADRFLIPEMWDRPGGSQSLGRASSTDASLSRRFADMPTLEADSLQWFGEGGEIGADEQDLRKAIKEWAKKRFSQGEIVSNADTGWQIQITPKGIKNTLAHGFDELLARSAPFIPKLVETGIHLDSVEKKAGLTSHIFANKIRLDGKDYVVGFVLREDGNGNRFYDHELTEIIDPNSLNRAEFPDGMGGHRTRANRGDVMNILREKLGVNDGSGSILFSGKKPNSAQVGFNPSEMGEHSGNIQNLGRESGTSGPDWLYRENNEKTLQNTGPANRGREVNILREKLGVNDGSGSILFSGKKPNGAQIGFNPSGMGEHSGNIQNLGRASSTDASLSRRFADMPTLEADSLQWFGEGRAISYSSEADSATMRKELRNSAKEWAKKRFSQGETIFNADTGWQIQITPKGIGDTLAHGFDELLARSAPFIPKLVETGIHLDSVEKKAGLTSHIFANKIRLDGKDYVVGFVLREDGNGNRFYDHELTEIIDPDWLAPGRDTSLEALGHRTNRGRVMNILREKLGVNDGSGSILFSGKGPRAQVNFDANGKAVITFFASADFSSAPHELYHVFRRDLADAAREPAASPRVREQWAKIEAFVGAKPGEAWTREMEEQFARAGERFLLEGKAPSPFLAEVFTQLKHWLLEIYADADAAGLEISPAMREVFNSMFSVPADQADVLFRSAAYYPRRDPGFRAGRAAGEVGEDTLNQAMYVAHENNIASFVRRVKSEGQQAKKSSFAWKGKGDFAEWEIHLPSDTVFHQANRHPDMTAEDNMRLPWIMAHLSDVEEAPPRKGREVYGKAFVGTASTEGVHYGVVFEVNRKGRIFLTTFFKDGSKNIENWMKEAKKKASRVPAASEPESAMNPGVGPGKPSIIVLQRYLEEVKEIMREEGKTKNQKKALAGYLGNDRASQAELHQDAPVSKRDAFISPDAVNLRSQYSDEASFPGFPVDSDANGKAVITFFASADFSSAPHELYHVFRRDLADAAREPAASPRVREQWAKIEAFVGAKPGEAWTREMEEQFARAGERFLLEGKAPSPFLAEVFTQLKHWLLEIYADADAAGLEISPAMREVFNSMFSVPADQADALFRSAVGELGVRQWEQDFLEGEGGGKLLGRYLSGFLTELTAQGQDRYALFRNGALDNEIVEALHMLDSSGKSAFQGPQEALEIAGIMRKWQEQVRADQKEAGTSDQETATVMRSDYKREQAVGALREAFTHDLESAVQRIASMRQPEAQLFTFPTNYRNINVKPEKVLTRLGSVLCSSFQEFPSFISEVSYQGQSFLASLQHDMKNLLKDRNSAEQQKIMNLCGVFFKNMINGLGSHLARQAVPGKIACTQHLFFRMNAFDWWSSVWKASVAALLQNDYAFKKERDGDEFTSGQHQETVSDTLLSEVLRLVSRFKSFPSAFALQGRAGEYWGRGMRAWGRVVQNQHGEINNFARLFLMFVLFGYGAMTAGRLGAGKTPHDPGEPKTWLAAAARSGALGLYADFLLGEKARLRSRQRMPGEGTTTEPGARPGNLWFSDNGEKRKTYNM